MPSRMHSGHWSSHEPFSLCLSPQMHCCKQLDMRLFHVCLRLLAALAISVSGPSIDVASVQCFVYLAQGRDFIIS